MTDYIMYALGFLIVVAIAIALCVLFTGAAPAIPGTGTVPTPPAVFPGR